MSLKVFVLLMLVAAAAASCDCDYHSGGCSISKPAPAGHKCVCVYKGWYTCSGWDQGCAAHEHCPGGQSGSDACYLGGGDCGGY